MKNLSREVVADKLNIIIRELLRNTIEQHHSPHISFHEIWCSFLHSTKKLHALSNLQKSSSQFFKNQNLKQIHVTPSLMLDLHLVFSCPTKRKKYTSFHCESKRENLTQKVKCLNSKILAHMHPTLSFNTVCSHKPQLQHRKGTTTRKHFLFSKKFRSYFYATQEKRKKEVFH